MDPDEKKRIAENTGIDADELKDVDDDTLQVMSDHDIDQDTAERAQELIDEGIDEDDAVEITEEL